MNESADNKDLKFWRALHEVLQDAQGSLPYFSDPERIHWDHPDDDWKNDAEVQAIEDDCSSDTDALIRHYCTKHSWPKRSKNNPRYFAAQRLNWALAFARVFTIALPETGVAAIPRPPQSGWELLGWLLIEAYHHRFPPPPKSPFYISGTDGKVTEIWT